VHSAGARVAAHSTIGTAGALVDAGVDSIEHGVGLDWDALQGMAERGTAWTPTLSAIVGLFNDPARTEDRRAQDQEAVDRFRELLPVAVRLGVPVLAETDVVGTIAGEVRLLREFGLSPQDALAAASTWPRQFLGLDAPSPDIVTYDHDPRDDPAILASPSAVVSGGVRLH
jgi:imidazolonepropionase-like amidohydrolase